MTVTVNGAAADYTSQSGYVVINRKWQSGDVVRVNMPMHLTAETTPDGKPQYSFLYGPIVLAAKTGTDRQDGLFADDSRGGHIANGPKIPLNEMPALIGTSSDILTHLQATDKPLTFRLQGVTIPRYEGLTLVPFYQLYECRYQIYFPLYSQSEWAAKQQQMAEAERQQMALEASTVDKVFCGEQQSESDHYFAERQSWNGSDGGQHWRRTRGQFSYRMKTAGATTLRFRGFDREPFAVMVGSQTIADIVQFGPDGLAVVKLPAGLSDINEVTVKAKEGKQTPRICEVRLMK